MKHQLHAIAAALAFFYRYRIGEKGSARSASAHSPLVNYTAQPQPRLYRKGRTGSRQHIRPSIITLLLTVVIITGGRGKRVFGQEFKAGSTIPEDLWTKPMQLLGQSGTADLSPYRDKLLILDFWATWCSPCVAMIPKMDSLQKAFAGDIQFVAVSYQAASLVSAFQKRLQEQQHIHSDIPQVVGDKYLSGAFRHVYLPHYVWIKGDKVLAITGLKEVSKENIQKILAGKNPGLHSKQDVILAYDKSKPLFLEGNGGDGSSMSYHSLFSAYLPGLGCGLSLKTDSSGGRKFTARNLTIPQLYRFAYSTDGRFFNKSNTVIQVADATGFSSNTSGEEYEDFLSKGNGYCYELKVPPAMAPKMFATMREDFDRFFVQYSAHIERRKRKYLSLELKGSSTAALESKGGEPQSHFSAQGAKMRNFPFDRFGQELQAVWLESYPLPLMDRTGYQGKVDMLLDCDMHSVEAINAAIARYDLQLIEREDDIDMLFISDRTPQN